MFLYTTKRVLELNETSRQGLANANISGVLYTATCYASPLAVESEVQCHGRSCHVRAMRKLSRDYLRVLSPYESSSDYFGLILHHMPGTGMAYNEGPTTRSSELVEHWIMNPELTQFDAVLRPGPELAWRNEDRWANVSLLSAMELGRRLQIAINTYWDASVGSMIRMGNSTVDQVDSLATDGNFSWNTTAVTGTKFAGD